MEGMSNATKLLLIGAAIALIGFFMPFIGAEGSEGNSLQEISKDVNTLTISMLALVAMVGLCFLPNLYKSNPKTFVTYELVAWILNAFFVLMFYFNEISEYSEYLDISIGGIMYVAGNLLIPIGLYQIWNTVGGGYVPPVFDAGPDAPRSNAQYAPPPSSNYAPPPPAQVYPAPRQHRAPQQAPVHAPARAYKPKANAWLSGRDGRSFQLFSGETSIGRSSSNDIQLDNQKVSKRHAKIVERNGHFTLTDLGSTNGTWVNGKLLREPKLLHSNDQIRFGDSYKTTFVTSGH